MERCIKHYTSDCKFKFLLKPMKFYYFKPMGLYILRKSPVIYLKEFGDNVTDVKIYNSKDNTVIPLTNLDFFKLELNQYVIITYVYGNSKKYQLVKDKYGFLEFEEMD